MIHPRTAFLLLLALLLSTPAFAFQQQWEDRLYGQVTTRDGEVLEGLIRWDKNEASWIDVLDGSKQAQRSHDSNTDNDRSGIKIFGIRFGDGHTGTRTRKSGIRFGYVKALEYEGSNTALLTLQNGDEIAFRGGSSDIGNDIREIIVEDAERGSVELKWRDLDRIDFMAPRNVVSSRFGDRLFGSLTTQSGDTFTGYICWDVDEVLTEDILDGTDEAGQKRKIAFGDIDLIERNSSGSAFVSLVTGEEVVLRGTNDVNKENRDILVIDPAIGQVRIPWSEFLRLSFSPPSYRLEYSDFDNSGPLLGTVFTQDGDKYKGRIRWDDDEAQTWELLNGDMDGLDMAIEFSQIREIERRTSRSAEVTLRNGQTFILRDSNDVDKDNDGIVILQPNGETVIVDWYDFDRVVFDKP